MKSILDLIPLFVVICGFVAIGYFIWRRAGGAKSKSANSPAGIGGWLLLLAVVQTLLPLKLIVTLVSDNRDYDPLLAMPDGSIAVYGKTALLVAFVAFQGFVIVQMYRKKRSFRTLFLYQWIAYLGLAIMDVLLGILVLGLPIDDVFAAKPFQEAAGSAIGWGLWALYVFRSVRIRNTFTA